MFGDRRRERPFAGDPGRESRICSILAHWRLAQRMQATVLRRRGPIHAQGRVIFGFCGRLRRFRAFFVRSAFLGRARQQRNRAFARGRPLHHRHRRRRAQMSQRAGEVHFFMAPIGQADIEPGKQIGLVKPALAAGVAELVDAPDLGSGDASRGGSSPSARTISLPTPQRQLTSERLAIIGQRRPLAATTTRRNVRCR